MPEVFEKDPNARLDYVWDWTGWMKPGDSIVTATVAQSAGVTVEPEVAINGARVTAWLTGGTAGTRGSVTLHIVTAEGREDECTLHIKLRQR